MRRLWLPSWISWHARGAVAYSWHGIFGDVCEMSRDVVALCIAFSGGADVEGVCSAPPAGLDPGDARRFVAILGDRQILVDEAHATDPLMDVAKRRPFVPRFAVYETMGEDVVVYGRAAVVRVGGAATFLARADGTRPLGELAPRGRWQELLRLCAPDLAALKLLPPGAGIPTWAESTMPWPVIDARAFVDGTAITGAPDDLAAYHAAIHDADAQFEETETTLSHLFRSPHVALGGESFGQRLAAALVARGVPAKGARVVETGGGLGWVGAALVRSLAPSSYLVVDRSPALARAQRARGLVSVVADALALPIADRSVDLVVSNEMCGDLGSDENSNFGALALVDESARVLAPGGILYMSEFGSPAGAPRKSDHLDHDEYSIRFDDLARRARERGLEAELVRVPKLIALERQRPALVTTRSSFAALRNVFRAHGGDLEKRAWTIEDLGAHAAALGVPLERVHGIVSASIGERTMGLLPDEFWALIASRKDA